MLFHKVDTISVQIIRDTLSKKCIQTPANNVQEIRIILSMIFLIKQLIDKHINTHVKKVKINACIEKEKEKKNK